jgi:ubiquinone/menaquinone biosynthesis C-methylase UbiE
VGRNGRGYSLDVSQRALDRLSDRAGKQGLGNIVTLLSSGNVEIPIDEGTLDHVLLFVKVLKIP